ncbi:MAG: DUF1501 domain-containing protein [Planctomyces sp.]|nr:DUF1501 domain-containing protein [Planctomyces sp.]
MTSQLSRREILRIGALSLFAPPLLARSAAAGLRPVPSRKCIYIMLQGGPSHLDMWDPKPAAPAEVRGPFAPASTNVPGLQLTSLSPETSKIADRLTVIRSMTHAFNNHIAGTYVMLTGSNAQPNADREAMPDDAPGPGALLNHLCGADAIVPPAVSLPTWLSIPGPSNRMPGQYGGILGSACDPFLIPGEPHKPGFRPLNLTLPDDVPAPRFTSRRQLLAGMDDIQRTLDAPETRVASGTRARAFDLLADSKFREALDLEQEPAEVRDRYGRTKIGQSLLLARRLVEAGVCFVEFNEFNQHWDTHGAIEASLKDRVPPLDRAFAALTSDLAERGLLDDVLVVCTGEFGRTPVINGEAGRDHWPDVYSLLLAGGGLQPGAFGASDPRGAYPARDPVTPADLLATLWHQLGIDPQTEYIDRTGRGHRLSTGRVLESILV